jgi:hypothetical protein
MGCVMRGMKNTFSFYTVNQDVLSGMVLALASIVILALLSDSSGGLQSLSLSQTKISV